MRTSYVQIELLGQQMIDLIIKSGRLNSMKLHSRIRYNGISACKDAESTSYKPVAIFYFPNFSASSYYLLTLP